MISLFWACLFFFIAIYNLLLPGFDNDFIFSFILSLIFGVCTHYSYHKNKELEYVNARAQCPKCNFIYEIIKNNNGPTYVVCPQCNTKGVIEQYDEPVHLPWGTKEIIYEKEAPILEERLSTNQQPLLEIPIEKEPIQEPKNIFMCSFCGKTLNSFEKYKCKYCGNIFGVNHHLPENHNCIGKLVSPPKRARTVYKF